MWRPWREYLLDTSIQGWTHAAGQFSSSSCSHSVFQKLREEWSISAILQYAFTIQLNKCSPYLVLLGDHISDHWTAPCLWAFQSTNHAGYSKSSQSGRVFGLLQIFVVIPPKDHLLYIHRTTTHLIGYMICKSTHPDIPKQTSIFLFPKWFGYFSIDAL